jgi:diguanylate cyclase (GGDEF)-like protein
VKTTLGTEQLLELSIFRGEQPEMVEWLLNVAEECTLEKGEELLHPDAANKRLYLVIDGSLRIELKGRERPVIAHIGAGECVGELSALDEQPAAAYVVANRRTRLMIVEREWLWRLIYTSHVVAKNLIYLLSARVRRDNEALARSLLLQHLYELNARTDALTGLYNRRWLDEMLPRLIDRANMSDGGLCLLLLDADHFKEYNDNYGHLAGDEALRVLASTVVSHIRPNDAAVRYGGEEIAVFLSGIKPVDALATGERIRRAISQTVVRGRDGSELPPVTVSIGAVLLRQGQDGEGLIAEADQALYQAKAGGRNRMVASWLDNGGTEGSGRSAW